MDSALHMMETLDCETVGGIGREVPEEWVTEDVGIMANYLKEVLRDTAGFKKALSSRVFP